MKKIIAKLVLTCLLTAIFIIPVSATEADKSEEKIDEYKVLAESLKKDVFITSEAMVDFRPVASKSTVALPKIDFSKLGYATPVTKSAYTASSSVNAVHVWLYNDYAIAISSTNSVTIDHIYTTCRIFKGNQTMIAIDSQDLANTSYVTATADYGNSSALSTSFGMGNHTYENSGYLDIVHETTDFF